MTTTAQGTAQGNAAMAPREISPFEDILSRYPPVLESLLAQLPTPGILALYHTSKYLRDFLQNYPLAWRTLSFRMPQPPAPTATPGHETPDSLGRQSKGYGFESLLQRVIRPYGTRLTSLDLCNTSVSGITLINSVLAPRIDCLKHLSVRGCKSVSLKYHIVPFLEPYTVEGSPWSPKGLALKSLYTYRCRHHRRRPYLPSSLARRDSDADPTHQLIEICHQLGIWTDTAWCPTPAGRCQRRKEYHDQRGGSPNKEIWVPFDRLWRSSNRFGPPAEGSKELSTDGRLWEIAETGQDGEPLGTSESSCKGEGKHVPAHERKSHRLFVENVKCSQCNETILERCESCSIRMHCMGCRKTLCESCAFNRPIPRKRVKTRHFASLAFGASTTLGTMMNQATGGPSSSQYPTPASAQDASQEETTPRFWWAPGATRSPNLMKESANEDDSDDSDDGGMGNLNNGIPMPHLNRNLPKLNMRWCCLEPIISGGGGIAIVGSGLGGKGADKIRACPLPPLPDYLDPDFVLNLRQQRHDIPLADYLLGEDIDILSYLKQDSLDLQAQTCPRSLCNDCYRGYRWKVSCKGCKKPLCKEHDFRGLKFRKCGFNDMPTERNIVRNWNYVGSPTMVIPEFKAGGNGKEKVTALPQLEHGDDAFLSQSQILVPPTPSTSNTNNNTASSNPQPSFAGPSTILPHRPISSTSNRPRSLSASSLRPKNSLFHPASSSRGPTQHTTISLPLPCNPRHPVQFEGCGAYFCQYPRPIGDNRTSCPAVLKECADCGVLVCDACLQQNPSCPCTYHTLNYNCPPCAAKPRNQQLCVLEVEIKAREEAKLQQERRREIEELERGWADDVAGAAYEFWSLMGDVHVEDWSGDAGGSGGNGDGGSEIAWVEGLEPAEMTGQATGSGSGNGGIGVMVEFGVSEELDDHHHQNLPGAPPSSPESNAADAGGFGLEQDDEELGTEHIEVADVSLAATAAPLVSADPVSPPAGMALQLLPAADPVLPLPSPAEGAGPSSSSATSGSTSVPGPSASASAPQQDEDQDSQSEDVGNSDNEDGDDEAAEGEEGEDDGESFADAWDSDTERALVEELMDEVFFSPA